MSLSLCEIHWSKQPVIDMVFMSKKSMYFDTLLEEEAEKQIRIARLKFLKRK